MLTIRHETPEDETAIRYVNEQAFGSTGDADMLELDSQRAGYKIAIIVDMGNPR